ncbi:MAG: hypothetical protein PHD81_02620 [Candidatus Nanoarchaeia archaeon]|nr:hypothetical protein [Candidatus Nanoarchaeia archaeon]MDD5587979.1 hypothetical protein [Candidatus Nanoarchaeia archaeon]
MKILNLFLVLLLVLPISLAAEEMAQTKIMAYPPYQANTGLNQYYTVDFDEEGDATVAAKIEIQNFDKEGVSQLQFEIPGTNVRMINLVQEYFLYTEDCSNWQKVCNSMGCLDQCTSYYPRQIWPPQYESINYETDTLSNSVLYRMKLPHKINQSETSSIIVYYKTRSYTQKNLGIFDFNFETIKLNYDTNSVNVGVSVSGDLHLKGTSQNVNYLPEFERAAQDFSMGKVGEMANVVGYIGQGSYSRNANSLDPMESFSLTGSYAKSWLNLYRFRIFIGLLIAIGLIFGAYYALKKLEVFEQKNAKKCIWSGIASSLALIILWTLTSLFLNLINKYAAYNVQSMIFLMVLLLIGIISLFVMFGPIVYFGLKYGLKEAVIATISFLISLVIFGIIATIILVLLMPSNSGPIYRYAMETAKAVMA